MVLLHLQSPEHESIMPGFWPKTNRDWQVTIEGKTKLPKFNSASQLALVKVYSETIHDWKVSDCSFLGWFFSSKNAICSFTCFHSNKFNVDPSFGVQKIKKQIDCRDFIASLIWLKSFYPIFIFSFIKRAMLLTVCFIFSLIKLGTTQTFFNRTCESCETSGINVTPQQV